MRGALASWAAVAAARRTGLRLCGCGDAGGGERGCCAADGAAAVPRCGEADGAAARRGRAVLRQTQVRRTGVLLCGCCDAGASGERGCGAAYVAAAVPRCGEADGAAVLRAGVRLVGQLCGGRGQLRCVRGV